jgi:hypothetical protein
MSKIRAYILKGKVERKGDRKKGVEIKRKIIKPKCSVYLDPEFLTSDRIIRTWSMSHATIA